MIPSIYVFEKTFFQDTENCPNSFKCMQFLAKFRPFIPIFPPPPIYYNPPISDLDRNSNPHAYNTPYNYNNVILL